MSKIHILEVNKFYYPHVGGIESVIKQHSEYFNNREDTEVKVLVCQEKGKASTENINGVEVYRAASLGTYFSCPLSFDFIRKFKKLAKWSDIIEFHTPFPVGDLACLLSGYKGKIVISWHSDVIKQKKLLFFYKPILKKFLKRTDKIITATQRHIDSSSFLPEFADKCTVIPYGINPDDYINCKNIKLDKHFLDKYASLSDSVKLLFVGRLVYYKGISELLQAFQLAFRELNCQNIELFIVGTGILENDAKNFVNENKLEKFVHFMEKLSDNDLKSAFASCDVFVFPSVENSEAFGIVQLEAMIYGKPVINTNLPTGVPEVSLDKITGETVEPKDVNSLAKAISNIAKDKEYREKLGENAKKRVLENYNEKINNKKLYNCFVEILKGEEK